ncbi:MAG: TPM domain-containing protein [Blastocatellia bacterium]
MKLTSGRAPVLSAILLCACLVTLAQQPEFPPYKGFVNDFANVIDDGTERQLQNLLFGFEKQTGAQIAVVTVPSLEGRPIEEYANALYRAWGIGAKSGDNKNKGALLLVSVGDRRSRLEVGYGLEGDLPDGLAGEMLRRMRPYFQQGNYSHGLAVGTQTILATLAEKWNISLDGIDRRFSYGGKTGAITISPLFLIGLFVAFLLLMFVLSRAARRARPAAHYRDSGWHSGPLIFGGGGGGFGGGDWGRGSNGGGGDSGGGGGDNWGGFGGGDSGGGGASDSW